jgi:two-component system, cell cycle response regulator
VVPWTQGVGAVAPARHSESRNARARGTRAGFAPRTRPHARDRRSAPGSAVPVLIVLEGPAVGQIFPLRSDVTSIGRDEDAHVCLSDDGVSRWHAVIAYDESAQGYLLQDLGSRNGTLLNGRPAEACEPLAVGDKIDIGGICLLRFGRTDESETQLVQTMVRASQRDHLTGAYNRRHLDERLRAEIAFARRKGVDFALLLVDVDHFKRVNDRAGHAAGDAVLRRLVTALVASARPEDVVARYGGDELAVLCRDTDECGARALAERLRGTIAGLGLPSDERPLEVTISIGVVSWKNHGFASPEELLAAADRALYAAKDGGRNRVTCHADLSSPAAVGAQ